MLQLKISVILPTYNRPSILARCLEGFAAQDIPSSDFEVVIVDDGSDPPAYGVVRSFEERLNIQYIYQENQGLAAARQRCIERARAPLLALHDDDDVPARDYLRRCLAFHAANPKEEAVLLCRVAWHPELKKDNLLDWVFSPEAAIIGFPEPGWHNYLKFYGGTSSCKKSIFRFAGYDPAYTFGFEDVELATRLNKFIALKVYYDPQVVSYLVRSPDLIGLIKRSYREGRSHRRYFEKYGEEALAATGEDVLHSAEFVRSLEHCISSVMATLNEFSRLSWHVDDSFEIAVENQKLNGKAALFFCLRLAVRYARAKGWCDQLNNLELSVGITQIDQILSAGETKQAPAVIPAANLGSEPRVDIVLNPGHHSWNVHLGWANTISQTGKLGLVMQPEENQIAEVFEYLKNPQSDLLLLCGFDHHLPYLHNSPEKRDVWRNVCVPKVLVAQETVLQDCYPDSESKSRSALECVDLAIFNSAADLPFYQEFSTPALWQSFGADHTVFSNQVQYRNRRPRAYFRGKTTPLGLPHTYQRRRELLKLLLDKGLVDYTEFQYSDVLAAMINEFNQYQICLNLPAVFAGFTTRVFESLACGCL
ncbi:MAG: glycosyltransferase family 2 protein, partial [Bdellovibrionales bacterium]|nr:glycosyltransferase family 2 protein [Bdellovibrionales bacterium]